MSEDARPLRNDRAKVGTPAAPERVFRRDQPHMGTRFQIQVTATDAVAAARAVDDAFAEVARVEALISEWQEESEISAVNRHAGDRPVKVGPEMVELFSTGKELSALTSGAFDMTFSGCGHLWSVREQRIPDDGAIEECLKSVDYRQLEIDEEASTIFLAKEGMQVGTGAIGKGYGVDAAAGILEDHGIDNYVVDGGGDIRVRGERLGRPWRVGVANPRGSGLLGTLEIASGAVVSSGDYERYFVKDGVRYHHIIDPNTGRPARRSMAVTVLAESATMADALSTGIFVLGPKRGLKLARSIEGVEALVVDLDGRLHTTDGMATRFDHASGVGGK